MFASNNSGKKPLTLALGFEYAPLDADWTNTTFDFTDLPASVQGPWDHPPYLILGFCRFMCFIGNKLRYLKEMIWPNDDDGAIMLA
ncbi:hypothetical protein CDV36_010181 [Fusarium kuroshium]|uniref:Uncharacterized protein n=1 Tax=Fusarium kuroshium TaxID=2010991 RepID=A0A3M2RXY7_9HYPO|nr:hypothetical protein CDV36_010181 [Fusarium kuroshium]